MNSLQPLTSPAPQILLVGDVMLDRYFDGTVDRISPEAPVPVLHVRRSFNRPGGAANVGVNMTAMGGTTMLVGTVGVDEAASELKTVLEKDGVSCGSLVTTAAATTTVKTRLLAGHSQIARFDQEAFLNDDPARMAVMSRISDLMPQADVAVISD